MCLGNFCHISRISAAQKRFASHGSKFPVLFSGRCNYRFNFLLRMRLVATIYTHFDFSTVKEPYLFFTSKYWSYILIERLAIASYFFIALFWKPNLFNWWKAYDYLCTSSTWLVMVKKMLLIYIITYVKRNI